MAGVMDKVSSICKGSAEGENDSMKIPKVLLLQSIKRRGKDKQG